MKLTNRDTLLYDDDVSLDNLDEPFDDFDSYTLNLSSMYLNQMHSFINEKLQQEFSQ